MSHEFLAEIAITAVKTVYRTFMDMCHSYTWNENVFFTACQEGDLDTVHSYIKRKGKDTINKGLLLAIANKKDTVAIYLLRQGASPEQGMEASIKTCNTNMIRELRKGAINHERYLTYMSENNLVSPLRVFLEEPCDTKQLNKALKIACEKCFMDIAELLIQKGASTSVGIRYAKTGNILKMCYRYEQKTENIN